MQLLCKYLSRGAHPCSFGKSRLWLIALGIVGEEGDTNLIGQCERINLGKQREKQMSHVDVTDRSHRPVLWHSQLCML